jgi:hypothetical protein
MFTSEFSFLENSRHQKYYAFEKKKGVIGLSLYTLYYRKICESLKGVRCKKNCLYMLDFPEKTRFFQKHFIEMYLRST